MGMKDEIEQRRAELRAKGVPVPVRTTAPSPDPRDTLLTHFRDWALDNDVVCDERNIWILVRREDPPTGDSQFPDHFQAHVLNKPERVGRVGYERLFVYDYRIDLSELRRAVIDYVANTPHEWSYDD